MFRTQFIGGKQVLPFLLCLFVSLMGPHVVSAQFAPTVRWERSYGGNADDGLASVEPTRDGGYILNGFSRSGRSGDKTQPNPGRSSMWIVKVDSSGTKQWDRTFGTASIEDEGAVRAVQTADGGYFLAGGAYVGASGDKTDPGRGYADFWVIKLNAQGNKQWDRAYGGIDGESLHSMQPTSDGGFILTGPSSSGVSGDKSQASRGIFDFWVLKIDAQGNKQWDRTIGGAGNDGSSAIVLTADGGYLVGGTSNSGVSGDKTQPALGGDFDYWVVKLNGQGQIQWDRTFGGTGEDQLLALQPTSDGGYLLGGSSGSGPSVDKTQASRGRYDYWIVKIDGLGRKQWDVTLGGSEDEWLTSLITSPDGGYVLGGYSESNVSGERTRPTRGGADAWLVKIDGSGRVLWDQAVGGSNNDAIRQVLPQRDGGYLLGSSSASGVSGNKSQPSNGLFDYWLVRMQAPAIRGDALLCAGGQVQLSAPAGLTSYLWNTGATTASIVVNQPGLYTVTGTSANGTTATLRHQVQSFTPPNLTLSGDTLLCTGRTGQLTAAAPGATGYQWSTGAATAATSITQAGTYTVTAFFGSGCTQQQAVRVRQVPTLPPLTLGNDTTLCEGQNLVLRAPATPGVVSTYRWSDGSAAATLRVQQGGTYSLQITSACESRTLTRRVATAPCLTIPNIITPNGDQVNDRWAVEGLRGEGWALEVFDRWGRRVFQTENYANEWGENVGAGVYFYLLRRVSTNATHKGWVEVVR